MTKKTTRIICIILAILMVFGLISFVFGSGAYAVTQAEIDQLQAQRDEIRSQQSDIQEQIDALRSEMSSAMAQKSALDEQNELNRQDIALIEEQIALYDEMIAEKGEEVDAAVAAEQAQLERFSARVRTMEETNRWTYVSVLLQADSLTDFLSRLTDVLDIVRSDQHVKEEYIAAREHVEQVKAEYEEIQDQQVEKRGELLLEQTRLEQQIEQANGVITALEGDIGSYETAYAEKEALEQKVQAAIDKKVEELRIQEEEERKAREAYEAQLREQERQRQLQLQQQQQQQQQLLLQQQQQQQTTTSSGTTGSSTTTSTTPTVSTAPTTSTTTTTTTTTSGGSSGYFTWPVPSCTYITSRYGYRVHPLTGNTKFHAGVDIGAGYNSAINAAAGGTVQISEKSDSYGYYCVIYHSNGTTTLYAHMNSMPIVSVGDTVSAGQQIGYVGSTGWSNGPHCHFEVRVNGSTVDPLGYFSGMSFSYASDA